MLCVNNKGCLIIIDNELMYDWIYDVVGFKVVDFQVVFVVIKKGGDK